MKQMIYVGPTVPGVAERNRIYRGIPEGIREKAREDPYFANLMIPIGELKAARQSLETRGSVLAVSYEEVAKGLVAGKEGNDGRV
ncbi:MAG: hypothetical protein HFH62_04555 [Lachnospiraceae bacterium]|nr:hypothetical protein [Lachnospiraceae bacterium]